MAPLYSDNAIKMEMITNGVELEKQKQRHATTLAIKKIQLNTKQTLNCV